VVSKKQRQKRRETLRPHPMRDQILDVMRSYGKPISPTQLARITGATLGSTAYHVRTLEAAGVIALAEEGRVRGAVEHFFSIVSDAQEARMSDPVMDLLGLCDLLTVPDPDGGYPHPVVLDEQARRDIEALIEKAEPRVRAIVEAALARATPTAAGASARAGSARRRG
jgi:DNA-binding transcriptional ArsR family regulator